MCYCTAWVMGDRHPCGLCLTSLVAMCDTDWQTAGPALCLLRSAVLDPGFLSALVEESTALRKVVELVSNKSYTTVTPHLMALASLANLCVLCCSVPPQHAPPVPQHAISPWRVLPQRGV